MPKLTGRKVVALGTQPITLTPFHSKDAATHIFASCDRPTVIFSSGRKLLYSTVNQPHVTYMAPFHSESFPECIALATSEGLSIGTIESIQKLHTRTVQLGEQPRRLAWLKDGQCIAVAVEAVTAAVLDAAVAGGAGQASSSSSTSSASASSASSASADREPNVLLERCFIRLVDETSYNRVASYPLDPNEIVISMTTMKLPLAAGTGNGSAASTSASSSASGSASASEGEHLIVGTAYVEEDEEEPSRGRILVLRVVPVAEGTGIGAEEGSDRAIQLVAHRETKGGVFSLATLSEGTRLAAGINSKVQVYKWGTSSAGTGTGSAGGAKPKTTGIGAVSASAALSSSSSSSASAATGFGGFGSASGAVSRPTLIPECGFSGNTLALYMDSRGGGGDFLLVGDLMKSMALLRYVPAESRLEEVACDPSHNWMTAVAMLDDGTFVGAEHHYNMFTAVRKVVGAPAETRSFLQATGEYHLGEMINRMVPGSLVMLPQAAGEDSVSSSAAAGAGTWTEGGAAGSAGGASASASSAKRRRTDIDGSSPSSSSSSSTTSAPAAFGARPRLVFGTVDGSIGALISLPQPLYRYLATLQTAINAVVHGVGGLSHTFWRSWHSERKTPSSVPVGGSLPLLKGYIDGDLIELFLDLDRGAQEKVVAAMNRLVGEKVCGEEGFQAALHPDGSVGNATASASASGGATVDEVVKVVEEMSRLH